MKKLLYFASDFKIGLSALLTDQLISIKESGIPVVAVAGQEEQEPGLGNRLSEKHIEITRIAGLDAHHDFSRLVNEIVRLVREHKIDLIHVQNNWQLAIAGYVKFKLLFKRKVEVVYTLHGFRHNSPIKSHIAQVVIGTALFFLANHVICMTNYLKRKFCLLSYKIKLIPLGINDEYFIPSFIPPQTDALHLIFPAQFRMGKNQDLIIRAFADYVKETKDSASDVTLPGNGPLKEKMQNLAVELGVGNQVHFPGLLSKEMVKKAYLASNIAIVASNSETFGQSIVEPYVLGRTVVSTPVGIATEIIKKGDNGYLFSSQSELTEVLLQIANHRQSLIEMGKNNFNLRDKFRWSCVTELYKKELIKD
jgi:glycosyltransferase involved in cell wall biosynthesis